MATHFSCFARKSEQKKATAILRAGERSPHGCNMGWRVALFAAFSDCDFPKNEAVEFAVGDGSLQKESAAFDWHYLLDERYVESHYLPVLQILASLLGIERATVLL